MQSKQIWVLVLMGVLAGQRGAHAQPTAPATPTAPTTPTAPPAPTESTPAPAASTPAPPVAKPTKPAQAAPATAEEQAALAAAATPADVTDGPGAVPPGHRGVPPRVGLVLDRAALARTGLTSVGELLQRLPVQANGVNPQLNNGGDGPTRVDLRGLHPARTLTLINGRRVVPGGLGADTSVDFNTIPLAMIERIELAEGGDAARHGSGAIAGTIDVITRRGVDTTEASLGSGVSSRGDGARYDASVITGVSSPRGSVTFGAAFQRQQAVMAGDRDFASVDRGIDYPTGVVNDSGSTAIPEGRINTRAIDSDGDGRADPPMNLCGTTPTGAPIQYCMADGAGGFRPFLNPEHLYNYQPENYLVTPSQRFQTFAFGERQLHRYARVFFEASYAGTEADQRLAPDPFATLAPISAQSIYNPLGATVLGYNRRFVEAGPRTSALDADTYRLVAGAAGDLGGLEGWTWETSYNLGRSRATVEQRGFSDVERVTRALGPSFFDASGVARCGTPDNLLEGCVPLNLLPGAAAGAVTREMLDYVGFTGVSSGDNRQHTLSARAAGPVAELPEGSAVTLAAGVEHRRDRGRFTPDAIIRSGRTTAGAGPAIDGDDRATEGFAALDAAPVLDAGPLRRLELDAAARVSHYASSGANLSWKLGAALRARGGLSLTASYARAFRAPSLAEQFTERRDTFVQIDDPCDASPVDPPPTGPRSPQCARQGVPADAAFGTSAQPVRTGGNRELEAERAGVLVVGAAAAPPAVPGLSLSATYSRIVIDDTIRAVGAAVLFERCYVLADNDACDRITRDPALGYAIASIDDRQRNAGRLASSTLDVGAGYQHELGRTAAAHRFDHHLAAAYLISHERDDTVASFDGKGTLELGALPAWRANLTSQWSYRAFSAGFAVRFLSGLTECNGACSSYEGEDVPSETRAANRRDVAANLTFDLFASYRVRSRAGTTELSLGIQNLLDADPPVIYNGLAADSDPTAYDYMGRFFTARISQQL